MPRRMPEVIGTRLGVDGGVEQRLTGDPKERVLGVAGQIADPAAHGDVQAVFKALYAAGVQGVFSDFPGLAVKARG